MTITERCDRCPGEGLVELAKVDGVTWLTLWFCSHHYRKHSWALVQDLWEVIGDNRVEAARRKP